jgi:hypothetical protein
MPSATEIRRQLRDADLRLYQIQQLAQGAAVSSRAARSRSMRGPVVMCIVAGLALVAAGEAARAVPSPERAADAATTSDVARPAHASDIALAPAPAAVTLHVRAVAPPQQQAPRTQVAAKRAAVRKPSTAGQRQAVATRARGERRQRAAQASAVKEHRQDDDRGLLRIRFVWDNPFK